jgi:hypothetical protein
MDLCQDADHHVIKVFMKNFGNGKLPICADCGKKANRKDAKWLSTCDRCFCTPDDHGKTRYTVCKNCIECPFYVGSFVV